MKVLSFTAACAVALFSGVANASPISLIAGDRLSGNGDFNYEAGDGSSSLPITENVPRDRAFLLTPNINASLSISEWTIVRRDYQGGNNAFGVDGNFGFDAASFEPANTGSGQGFTNGNNGSVIDFIADTINQAGGVDDVFDLSYLLGSDSSGGLADVTLTLDAGLPSEQIFVFAQQSRAGSLRDGSNTIVEQATSLDAYSTVDLTIQINPAQGSTRALIDDVRLSVTPAIPEPATTALCVLGMAGVAMRRRRG